MNATYEPRAFDIQWARNVVTSIKDGGTLEYPDTGCVYIADLKTKTMELQNPAILSYPDSRKMHERSIIVFAKIGWSVTQRGQACN